MVIAYQSQMHHKYSTTHMKAVMYQVEINAMPKQLKAAAAIVYTIP